MGLWGTQTGFSLVERMPDIPKAATAMDDIEARALRERLDVRSAIAESDFVAQQAGVQRIEGYLDGLTLTATRNTTFDNTSGEKSAKRGWELELPLPLFDWGGARNARAQAVYRQSTARVRNVAVRARSEAREAYFGYRTAYDLAVHYRDEVVPLRKLIHEELVLRYSGMLASVWELLADTRQQVLAVNSALEAQRDFWLAEADLQTTLSSTSPGALASSTSGTSAEAPTPQGH
jgi:outer membrane protein TolC